MSIVTTLWCLSTALALTLAGLCLLFWLVERRDLTYLSFCIIAVSTAVATPFELGMMLATTPAGYGELLRWYHLPLFIVLAGHVFFVRNYLGTGRPWLLWAFICMRLAVLIINFLVDPNFNFREITSLQHLSFLGEQVSVIGRSVMRPMQWLGVCSSILLISFVIDATIQARLRGSTEFRRRALIAGVAIVVPMTSSIVENMLVAGGVLHFPVINSIWFLGTLSVVAYELGREVIINRRAQWQLSRLQSELVQLDRVNTLGQFASGLAHELVQPLTAATCNAGAAELLMQQTAPDLAELRVIMGNIKKDMTRAGDTIHHMRALIQRRALERQSVAVHEVVRDVLLIAGPEAASRQVVLECRIAPGLPRALCDPVQISQVLLNLLINGMDAVMTRPGDTRRVDVEAYADKHGRLELAVSDSGPGIPDGKLDAVFSPLFTTKAHGLGMGLAICRTIIEAHGGNLWALNSTTTSGAVFRFTLPRA
jgi:C4-dicarboxylate-specific signal transduction histidine kinase